MTSSPLVIKFPEDTSKHETHNLAVSALKKNGWFMAEYGTLKEFRSKLFEASKEIFDRLDKTKPDFDIPGATTDEGIQNFIPSMQPKGRQDILNYTRTATALEQMVRKVVFGPEKLPKTGFRFQMMKEEISLDFLDHEDREEFLAVLDLNQVEGLEMRTTDGNCSRIEVRPSTFLIMAGKPFKDWSKGKILRENEEKYAVGLFSYCKKDN